MGDFMTNAKSVGAGFLAVEASELIFYKLFPRVPFLNDKTMLSRAIIAGAATLGMQKTSGVARDAMLCVAAHNLTGAAHTVQQVHDFLGISDNTIDTVASEAVAAIEASLTEELEKLKESMGAGVTDSVSSPMSNKYEDVEFEMVP